MNRPPAVPGGEFAVLTATGPAAIAVIRVCGPPTGEFLKRHVRIRAGLDLASCAVGRVVRAALVDNTAQPFDDILLSIHAPPPEWDVRLHLHGSPRLVAQCVALLRSIGLREAPRTPSLWPTADALEAEAWALLPTMHTARGAAWLLQQPARWNAWTTTLHESSALESSRSQCREVAARLPIVEWFSRPLRVALVGPPNAGKSTLINALADQAVSIVAPTPGTTRDWVEVPGEANGFPVVWIDTAGLRETPDPLEAAGVARAHAQLAAADAIVVVMDATPAAIDAFNAFIAGYSDLHPTCVVLNKCDLAEPQAALARLVPEWRTRAVAVSATRGTGLDDLCRTLMHHVGRSTAELDHPAAFTSRQARWLNLGASATDQRQLDAVIASIRSGAELL